jgi:hypothetical protein
VPRSTSMQKHSSRRKEFRQFLGNSRSHDSVAISRRFALRIEPLGLMERLTTESVRAEIDRSSRPAISERDDVTVPLAPGTRDQEQSTRTKSRQPADMRTRCDSRSDDGSSGRDESGALAVVLKGPGIATDIRSYRGYVRGARDLSGAAISTGQRLYGKVNRPGQGHARRVCAQTALESTKLRP